jgi:hypothetical protein
MNRDETTQGSANMWMHNDSSWGMGHPFSSRSLLARCGGAAFFCLLVQQLACPLEAWGQQVTQLEDILPLAQVETTIAEMETRPDDLIQFATSYADALRDLKIAQLSGETLQSLRPNAVITPLELQIAGINMRTAETKVAMIRAVIEKQIAATDARLRALRRLETIEQEADEREAEPRGGTASLIAERIAQAEATKSILQMILNDEAGSILKCASTDRKSHAAGATATAPSRPPKLTQQHTGQRRRFE